MEALQQEPGGVSIRAACHALGLGRASYYRDGSPLCDDTTSGSPPASVRRRPAPPRKLTPTERDQVVEHLHSERFVDQPPREIFATLLTEGEYVCSVRTMYRILNTLDATSERRSQRAPMTFEAPFVRASAPNQVWVWDITALPATGAHKWLYAYAVLDLYSRYVVAWLISPVQAAVHAERLFAEACAMHDVAPEQLCVHSDRGSPMTSGRLSDLFSRLGVNSSFNRPHVSNDNPHAEAHFRTMKYQGDFPKRFRLEAARTRMVGPVLHLVQPGAQARFARPVHPREPLPRRCRRHHRHAAGGPRPSLHGPSSAVRQRPAGRETPPGVHRDQPVGLHRT